uniref:Endonuclease/exonuclease/phosphatase domain-containing protein n=1 Tax=Kryptolebias marmoratus TaxID=37003 RepID=A0A3Q3EUJ7_KRYMA
PVPHKRWYRPLIELSLVNMYAPNTDAPKFIKSLFKVILQHSTGLLLVGGDFNCILSQILDRLPTPKTPLSRMSRMLKYQIIETGIYCKHYPS